MCSADARHGTTRSIPQAFARAQASSSAHTGMAASCARQSGECFLRPGAVAVPAALCNRSVRFSMRCRRGWALTGMPSRQRGNAKLTLRVSRRGAVGSRFRRRRRCTQRARPNRPMLGRAPPNAHEARACADDACWCRGSVRRGGLPLRGCPRAGSSGGGALRCEAGSDLSPRSLSVSSRNPSMYATRRAMAVARQRRSRGRAGGNGSALAAAAALRGTSHTARVPLVD